MHVYSGSPSALGRRRFYPDPTARTSLFSRELRRVRIKTVWGQLDRLEKPLEEFLPLAAVELDLEDRVLPVRDPRDRSERTSA